ncbi:MAG: hypothetical protein JWR85_153 [Marmoricola sp.]|nr:hypothetical protein [Marmoricola sp.]
MAASRTPMRRRQRSVRVTVSVVLLSVATAAVLASLPAQSPLWLSLASLTALALAWGALRIMWTEVLESRRENAADRAAAAAAYRSLFSVRAVEHAEFTTAMTERLAEAHLSQRELEGLVTQHESRAQRAESKLNDAQVRVQTLEETVAALQAAGPDAVVELVAWEEQAGQRVAQKKEQQKAKSRPALKRA